MNTIMDDEMLPYSGPRVECETPDGEIIEGLVICAVCIEGGDFDTEAQFVVLTDEGERFTMYGWAVTTTVLE